MPKAERKLPAIHPSAGTEALYRDRLVRLIDEMARSILWWVRACYRANQPAILAMDADPADELQAQVDELRARWQKRFDDGADDLAAWFAKAQAQRTDFALKRALKKAGFTIRFKMTPAQKDIIAASVNANVSLIRSIPEKYLTDVEGSVMRAVQQGMDLGQLTRELQEHHGVTKRRAKFIAKDQGSKATAALKKARETELGIEEEIWVHSGGGAHPRPSHQKAGRDSVRYRVSEGWLDPAINKRIWPGTEINCFPGDTLIDLVNGCHKVWRYDYRGDLVTLEAGKAVISATPNHPLLTSKGWIAAQAINKGDDVWQARLKKLDPLVGDEDQTKFCISDVFRALSRLAPASVSGRTAETIFDFHGDIPNAEVETVRAERELFDKWNGGRDQGVAEFDLSKPNGTAIGICPAGREIGHSSFSGGACDSLKVLDGRVSETQDVGLASVSGLNASLLEAASDEQSGNAKMLGDGRNTFLFLEHQDELRVAEIVEILARFNSASSQDSTNDRRGNPEMTSDLRGRLPVALHVNDGVEVEIDALVSGAQSSVLGRVAISSEVLAQLVRVHAEVGRKSFECGEFLFEAIRVSQKGRRENSCGHVYTIESNDGWFGASSENLVTKNCRCVGRAVIPGLD